MNNHKTYKKISSELGVLYFFQIFAIIIGFFIFPLLTRYLTIEDYGIYSLLIITINLTTSILSLGLNNFIQRDLTGKTDTYKKNKFSIINSFYLVNIVILSILFLIFLLINKKINIINEILAIYLFFSIIIIYYSNIFIAYINSQLKIKKASIHAHLLIEGWYVPIILLGIILNNLNVNLIFLLKSLTSLSVFILIILSIKKIKRLFKFNLDKVYLKKALIYGFPFIPIIIAQSIITASDRYFIKILSTNINLGYYAYMYTLVAFIATMGSQINNVLKHYLIEAKNKKQKQRVNFLFNASLKYSLLLTIPAIVGLYVLKTEIITAISGPKYLAAIYILPILMFFPLFRIINLNLQNILILKKNTKKISNIYLSGTITNILLNFLLIPQYGILGAAIATTATYAIMTILFIKATKNQYKLNFNFLKIPQILISSTIMYITLSFLSPTNIYSKIATILLGVFVYFISIIITKGYVKEEKELIKNILKIKKYRP